MGIKLRASPHNHSPLRNVTVVLAVPPLVDPPTSSSSLVGKLWNGLQRTLTWKVLDGDVTPGAAREWQLVLPRTTTTTTNTVDDTTAERLVFPILVRAEQPDSHWSGVEVVNSTTTGGSITTTGAILHRSIGC